MYRLSALWLMSDPRRDQHEDLDDTLPENEGNYDIGDTDTSQADKTETSASSPASSQVAEPAEGGQKSDKPASDSRFFAIRTTGGQERMVADMLYTKVTAKKIGIRSVIVLDSFKGYIIVEAPDANVAYEGLAGIRHVRGQIRG